MKKNILIGIVVVDLLAVNVLVGYLGWSKWKEWNSDEPLVDPQSLEPQIIRQENNKTEYVDRCGEECKLAIRNEVISLIPTGQPTVIPSKAVVKQTSTKKVRREEILTIPGSGSSVANEWTDLGGTYFYFDTRDYPGLVEVFFEANMRLFNGNGMAYLRLYDATNSIAVVGSDNNTDSQTDVWVKSQKLNFWAGRNLVRVQAKSLTADTVVYNSGRLRIITEN